METSTNKSRLYVSSEVRFYTIEDLQKMLGWSEKTVQKLFNDPVFPSSDYGRVKVVEAHALIDFFSKKHEKVTSRHWSRKGCRDAGKISGTTRKRRGFIQREEWQGRTQDLL